MFQKTLHFIKYNNATVIILAVVLILGGGALAAGPENIGQKQTSVQGFDNTALLAADLENFNMDFKIENLEQDEKYYYATYGFLDLAEADGAWQYQLRQKTQKISKKIKQDLGEYLIKFLAKHYEARMRELKQEKNQAQSAGEQRRVEVTEYSGLIGRMLDIAAKVFPGYEPVVKRELPAPEFNPTIPISPSASSVRLSSPKSGQADNLTKIYNDYLAAHPELLDSLTAEATSTPEILDVPAEPEVLPAEVASTPAEPETPPVPEATTVEIIELPAPTDSAPAENAAPTEPAAAQ